MDPEPNVFQAAIVDEFPDGEPYARLYRPEGFPPKALIWIGIFLIFAIIVAILDPQFYSWKMMLIIPCRLVWAVFARVQMARHEMTWQPGDRRFLMAVWVINVLILILDAMLILLYGTCVLLITP